MPKRVLVIVAIAAFITAGLSWVLLKPSATPAPTVGVSRIPLTAAPSVESSAKPIQTSSTPLAPNANLTASSTVDTSAWKTYRNEKYSFAVNYPEGFHVTEFDDRCDKVSMSDLSLQDPTFCYALYVFDPVAKLGYLSLAFAKTNQSLSGFAAEKKQGTEITSGLSQSNHY
jgi:hypothetical protein